jgi:hypothetical protein
MQEYSCPDKRGIGVDFSCRRDIPVPIKRESGLENPSYREGRESQSETPAAFGLTYSK